MTEHDRGAYTPPSDMPLAFDPRRGGERRPAPMMLIASFAVLLVLAAVVFMALRHGGRPPGPVRPVGASVGAIKSAAPQPGSRPGGDGVDVFASQNVPSTSAGEPRLAPAPETPQPRPAAPQLQVRSVAPTPVRIEPAAAPATTAVVTTASTTRTTSAPAHGASTVVHAGAADAAARAPRGPTPETATPRSLAADRAATMTVDAALARAAAPASVRTSVSTERGVGSSGVQIGAFSSRDLADQGFLDAGALMGGAMAGKGKSITPVPKDGKTLFRTVITGFADHAAARAFCASLTAKGRVCIVKG